jgi:predicted amidohydrolase
MGKYLGVSMVQLNIVPGNTEANVSRMLQIAEGAMEDFPWLNLICFSELAIPGFNAATWEQQAEPVPGPTTERFAAFAKKHQVYVIPGSLFEKDGGNVYNTAPILGPEGQLVTKYRKMFPWRPLEPTTPGTEFCVFDIPDLCRVGVCICYDFWFPEVCRQLAWMGADVIVHPTMTPTAMAGPEKNVAIVRALENQVYMVSISGCGIHGGIGLGGGSILVGPNGRILQELDKSENIVNELLDLERVELAQEYGSVCMSVQNMKHLLEYNHKFPMYADLEKGEFFKKRKGTAPIETYISRRQIKLPFTF